MDDYQAVAFASLAVAIAIYAVRWYSDPVSTPCLHPKFAPPILATGAECCPCPQLRAIPTVGGSSLPGLSYLGAFRMLGDCRNVLGEGYRKASLAPPLRLLTWSWKPSSPGGCSPIHSTRSPRSRSRPSTSGWSSFRGGAWWRSSGNAGTKSSPSQGAPKRCACLRVQRLSGSGNGN